MEDVLDLSAGNLNFWDQEQMEDVFCPPEKHNI